MLGRIIIRPIVFFNYNYAIDRSIYTNVWLKQIQEKKKKLDKGWTLIHFWQVIIMQVCVELSQFITRKKEKQ